MASTSSSSLSPYHVFINCFPSDMSYAFATKIYHTLTNAHDGLRVFLNNVAPEQGDYIARETEYAIHNSKLHIAIFSPSYAQSPWCLEELFLMLRSGTKTIPIFYTVEPSSLRWVNQGKGVYIPAFSEHEKQNRYTPEKLQEWKMALYSVSFFYGYEVKDTEDEGMKLKTIVNQTLMDMKNVPLKVPVHRVGLSELLQNFERTLECSDSGQYVKIMGIVGMGGCGKTTLATEFYNNKLSLFKHCTFINRVRDSKDALYTLQMELLQGLLPPKLVSLRFDNERDGKRVLTNRLRSLRVFIVLDDVDDVNQIDALLPAKDMLGSGSVIIITTREAEVLSLRGIPQYRMNGLKPYHARQLFCWHAFLQSEPLEGYEDLVEKYLNVCEGLPLSLKVFGGLLYNHPKDYWMSQLDKVSGILPEDITKTLKISFDALDDEEKEMFLDAACFFLGEEKSLAIEIWDGSHWSGLYSWERLLNKCLVDLDRENRIWMHDHLRDMGREIATRGEPYRFFPLSRLNVRDQAQERMLIRGIMEGSFHLESVKRFANYRPLLKECMNLIDSWRLQVELLVVANNDFTEQFAILSKHLVWLRWVDFHHKNLPSWLSLENLSVLEIHGAVFLEELWEEDVDEPPLKLRELIISYASSFKRFPRSIGCARHLKKICVFGLSFPDLRRCPMRELPDELCDLDSLEHLELKSCCLLSLPIGLGDLSNLRHLNLTGCKELTALPASFKYLKHLQYLDLSHCNKLIFTEENADIMANITKLEYLSCDGCEGLQVLPHQITNQTFLRQLKLSGTRLKEVPCSIGQLGKLQVLEIGSELLTSLPSSLGNLSCLKTLFIESCGLLESLPNSVGDLQCLSRLSIYHCKKLESLPESIGRLSLLNSLDIQYSGLKSLPKTLFLLSNLETLTTNDCPISECVFESLCNLREIDLSETRVSTISIPEECCPKLQSLDLSLNKYLEEIETLPTSVKTLKLLNCAMLKNIMCIGRLQNLTNLYIAECPKLAKLPSFANLVSIKTFSMQECPSVDKIEGLEHSKSLETLTVHTCWEMPRITSLNEMEKLRRLELLANNLSALEPFIQSLQKWPCEIIICGRAERGVEVLKSTLAVSDPDLAVVEAFNDDKKVILKCPKTNFSNPAAILCYDVNVGPKYGYLMSCFSEEENFVRETYDRISTMALQVGKWVWIGVFREGSSLLEAIEYAIIKKRRVRPEKGILVMAEEGRVNELFYTMLHS